MAGLAALYRVGIEAALTGRFERYAEVFDPDCAFHGSFGRVYSLAERTAMDAAALRHGYDIQVLSLVESGDTLAAHSLLIATPADGEPASPLRIMDFCRARDGRFVELWTVYNQLEVLVRAPAELRPQLVPYLALPGSIGVTITGSAS